MNNDITRQWRVHFHVTCEPQGNLQRSTHEIWHVLTNRERSVSPAGKRDNCPKLCLCCHTIEKVSPDAGAVVNAVNVSNGSAAAVAAVMSVAWPLNAAVVVVVSKMMIRPTH